MTDTLTLIVMGSVNLDLVASVSRLPIPGETVSGATLSRYPGGKGANQALAARRLGADVYLAGCTGADTEATQALALLQADGVDLSLCQVDVDSATGIALIAVAADGENQIVVAPGANRKLTSSQLNLPTADALICQLEVPVDTIAECTSEFNGFVCINLAPAAKVPVEILRRADLIVMNETEAQFIGDDISVCENLVAISYGSRGAVLLRQGEVISRASPPSVDAIDTTGAGDTFTAALTLALLEGETPDKSLAFACAAGALATTRPGAQPSLPWRRDVDALLGNQ